MGPAHWESTRLAAVHTDIRPRAKPSAGCVESCATGYQLATARVKFCTLAEGSLRGGSLRSHSRSNRCCHPSRTRSCSTSCSQSQCCRWDLQSRAFLCVDLLEMSRACDMGWLTACMRVSMEDTSQHATVQQRPSRRQGSGRRDCRRHWPTYFRHAVKVRVKRTAC